MELDSDKAALKCTASNKGGCDTAIAMGLRGVGVWTASVSSRTPYYPAVKDALQGHDMLHKLGGRLRRGFLEDIIVETALEKAGRPLVGIKNDSGEGDLSVQELQAVY